MLKQSTLKLLIPAFFIISCSQKIEKGESKYFEGFVDFTMTQTFYDSSQSQFNREGKIRTYVNNEGFFSRQYIDSSSIIFSWEVYRPDSLCIYQYYNNGDSIFRSPTTDDSNDKNIDMMDVQPIKINDKYYPGCKLLNKLFDKRSGLYRNYYTTYYYDTTRLLSPGSYKKCIKGGYENIFSKHPYLTVAYCIEFPESVKLSGVATRIVEADVPNLHFELPKKKKIVEADF